MKSQKKINKKTLIKLKFNLKKLKKIMKKIKNFIITKLIQ